MVQLLLLPLQCLHPMSAWYAETFQAPIIMLLATRVHRSLPKI